jgi:AcrR family transcriptional regulator
MNICLFAQRKALFLNLPRHNSSDNGRYGTKRKKNSVMKTVLKDDRRTQKTKKYLAEALKELILEKGYEEITIQDIIDRANVGRSTFYSHYESKEQLLVGNINFQQALIETPINDPENYPMGVNLAYLFNHTKEHLHLTKAMSGSKSIDILGNHFTDICAVQIYTYLKQQPQGRANPQMTRYKAEAAAGGIVRMLLSWLKDDATIPVDEMISHSKHILSTCYPGHDHRTSASESR